MENKSYQLRYLPIFETDLLSTVNYITNVLKKEFFLNISENRKL